MFIPFHDDNPTRRTPVVTYALVAVNVLVFLWMSRLPELRQEVLAYQHGFVPARVSAIEPTPSDFCAHPSGRARPILGPTRGKARP